MKFIPISILAPAVLAGCAVAPVDQFQQLAVKGAAYDAHLASEKKPVIKKFETITATGYAVVDSQRSSDLPSKRLMAIRAAKLDAYRSLTEQVFGQHIDASTTVSDLTVTSDSFRARVEGVVYGARLVSITPNEDSYEVTLSLDQDTVKELRKIYEIQSAPR